MVILIVGHSRASKGAYNKDRKIWEYDLNEYEANKVFEILTNKNIPCGIVYRETYSGLPKKVNAYNPKFIVSFHHNSFDENSTGTETLYYHKSKKGKELAKVIQRKTVEALGYKDRGIKAKDGEDRGGYLLKYTNAPCVILEPCFISNNAELDNFIENQDKYCNAVAEGIIEFINM